MMAGTVEEDAEQPSPAVGAEFEVGKLAPSDEEGLSEDILGWISATERLKVSTVKIRT